jgi:hypothetical protein
MEMLLIHFEELYKKSVQQFTSFFLRGETTSGAGIAWNQGCMGQRTHPDTKLNYLFIVNIKLFSVFIFQLSTFLLFHLQVLTS